MNYSSVILQRSFLTQLPNTTETLNVKLPASSLLTVDKAFDYMLYDVAKQNQISEELLKIAEKIAEFCKLNRFGIKNLDIFKKYPHPQTFPKEALYLFVVRLLKKIHNENIRPLTDKVISLVKNLDSPALHAISVDPLGYVNQLNIIVPEYMPTKDLTADCQVWKDNYTPEKQKLLQDYFNSVKVWFQTQLLDAVFVKSPQYETKVKIIEQLGNITTSLDKYFPKHVLFCDKMQSQLEGMDDKNAEIQIYTEEYYQILIAKFELIYSLPTLINNIEFEANKLQIRLEKKAKENRLPPTYFNL